MHSHVKRQNLTMRMSMRRFTRLTNGFSKKIENHYFATALYFVYYNFGKNHQTFTGNTGNGSGSFGSCVESERDCETCELD